MMWIAILFAVVTVNALFDTAIFGVSARWILLVIALLAVAYFAFYKITHKDLYEQLIQTEHVTITRQGSGQDKFPLYGQTAAYYYIIYPAVNYRISHDNSCIGFSPYNIDTWCGEERYFARCNTQDNPSNCTSHSVQK